MPSPGPCGRVVSTSIWTTPELAQRSLNTALARYGEDKADGGSGWHFLTGDEANVAALMDSIGFQYRYDPQTDEYAHAGGVVLLTQDGTISRYFYGVDYAPKDLRLGLVEASENQLGNVVDQVLLFCYQYDPAIGKYSALSMNIIRVAGVLTGRNERRILNHLLGGDLELEWKEADNHVYMTGPAVEVYRGEFTL